MKMGAGMFMGIFFILIGAGIVIKILFNIDFPVIKVLVAFFFVWIGLRIMFGNFHTGFVTSEGNKHDVVFGEKKWKSDSMAAGEYNCVFGKAVYDLRDYQLKGTETEYMEIHTVFGGSVLKIRKDMPVKIEANSAFAGVQMPNGNMTSFGSNKYESAAYRPDSAHLRIKAEVVFGGLQIEEY
jgi:hypothetical protein